MSDRRNHSPGPWRVGSDGVTVILSDGQEINVASPALDRARANAHLIAAAPELYASLRVMLDWYGNYILESLDGLS